MQAPAPEVPHRLPTASFRALGSPAPVFEDPEAEAAPPESLSGPEPGTPQTRESDRRVTRPQASAAGRLLAHTKQYRVFEKIGVGGMGVVFRAHDPVLARDVALKVMKKGLPSEARQRFRQEALWGARFSHPAIVRVYDLVGVPGQGVSWFAMEYLPGRDLAAMVESRGSREPGGLPYRLLADAFRQVLGGLQYAHDCGVIHRDVKPENLFVTRDPNTRFVTTKLLDFGVALELPKNGPALADRIVGDPRYIAPEQTQRGGAIDHRADLYAAGMSLYELLTGTHPFEDLVKADAPVRAWLKAQRERPVPGPSMWLGDLPPVLAIELDHFLQKACEKDPANRYQSAREMQQELGRIFAGVV